jgi:toxin ParE1/3/4
MQLLITPLAAFDLEEIGDYVAQDNPVRAGTFVAELRAHCEKICLNPAGFRRRPGDNSNGKLRTMTTAAVP